MSSRTTPALREGKLGIGMCDAELSSAADWPLVLGDGGNLVCLGRSWHIITQALWMRHPRNSEPVNRDVINRRQLPKMEEVSHSQIKRGRTK